MTWAEFKAQMEAAGVTDQTKIWYIDVAYPVDLQISVTPSGSGGKEVSVTDE